MKNSGYELRSIVQRYIPQLNALTKEEFSAKPFPDKWSKSEVLGHLIDSAQNNLRRFISAQYESEPPCILYNQDFWVGINDYQSMPKDDLIQLWRLINERICAICEATSENKYNSLCNTGREREELHTIAWLAADYIKHLKHHLNQIFPKSFDVVYP
ncbi:MAG TPA: DinB family protein [Ohtaekwangia sp.]|nr:DinB family protein [Ohtaekwangia sp.]